MSDSIRDAFSIVLTSVDHGEEVLEVEDKIVIPVSNQAGTDNNVLSTVDNKEEITEVCGLKEEEVNHEIQEEMSDLIRDEFSIVLTSIDHGEEVLEVEDKIVFPVSNQAGTDNNVLSTVDNKEEIIEVCGLKEEDHGEEMVEANELAETNELAKSEVEIKIPLSKLVYNIGLSEFNHEEEKLTDVDALVERDMKNKVLRYLPDLLITSVKRVENNFLTGMYYLKKEEYQSRNIIVQEKLLFHATAAMNVNSIIKDNFDWQKSNRCKYGSGISFATDADYANCHSNRHNGSSRAFIITKVLIGKSTEGSSHLGIPAEGIDTTTGANGIVVVKYNHNEYLPKYVVYYNCYDITKSKYYSRPRKSSWLW